MEVNVTTQGDVTIVDLSGDIDGRTSPQAQSVISANLSDGVKLLLNMTQVPYMSSAGLRMLLLVYRQIIAKQGKVVLVGLSEDLQDTMAATGFLDHFDTFGTVEDGITHLNA
ncbi:MAG: anti-sigma B factor antagonist [Ectothiorhodospiraceae bacterium]|nr:anti-sigma B factor antagonist [Ectothiorhodospiraceae bacterium]